MTEVGKTQGYTGCERKNDSSEIGEDGEDDGEEEYEDMRCVLFKVKQENLHVPGGCHEDIGVWCRHSRRWRGE